MEGMVAYDWPSGHTKQVAYANQGFGHSAALRDHIQELYVGVGGRWQVADLTAITNASPVVAYEGIVAYQWQAGGTKQVVYEGPSFSLQELYVGVGGDWQVANLSAITGAFLGG